MEQDIADIVDDGPDSPEDIAMVEALITERSIPSDHRALQLLREAAAIEFSVASQALSELVAYGGSEKMKAYCCGKISMLQSLGLVENN